MKRQCQPVTEENTCSILNVSRYINVFAEILWKFVCGGCASGSEVYSYIMWCGRAVKFKMLPSAVLAAIIQIRDRNMSLRLNYFEITVNATTYLKILSERTILWERNKHLELWLIAW